MALLVDIPGRQGFELNFLLLDLNGTLSDRGALIDGAADRLARLRPRLDVRLLSADTFGTLDSIATALGVQAQRVATGADKLAVLQALGAERCAAVGNGMNDLAMIREAAVGIVVVEGEGTSGATLAAADVVCRSILDALDLLADPQALASTLRA